VSEGQVVPLSRLIRAAGLRWSAGELQTAKGCFRLEQSQICPYPRQFMRVRG
jgi:hypothetical protein